MGLLKGKSKRKATGIDEMSLVAHLSELRGRLMKSVLAIAVGAIAAYAAHQQMLGFLQEPYCDYKGLRGEDCEFLTTRPLENFSVVLSVSGYGGLILAMPVILYQLARFVLPGLYPKERRALWPFFVVSVLLMAGGMVGGYLLMPKTLSVLLSFGTEEFTDKLSPGAYYGFFIKMVFAFGVAAQLPLVLVFLQSAGIVPTKALKTNRRISVVAVVLLAAVITPTGDPFTLLVMAVPMYLSYEVAIVIGGRMSKTRSPEQIGS